MKLFTKQSSIRKHFNQFSRELKIFALVLHKSEYVDMMK